MEAAFFAIIFLSIRAKKSNAIVSKKSNVDDIET
jgi:hypothetical protein